MAQITFKGNPIHTAGSLPPEGSDAPDFLLTNASLEDVNLSTFAGKKKILSIVPSLDTGICAASAIRFNQEVASKEDVVLLNISADLPFAAGRFCSEKELNNVVTLSTFRAPSFGKDYGVEIVDGPLAGLLSRAILVLDDKNQIIYTEQVPEIAQEPNYEAALVALDQ